jgi:DNA-3-methyladenine glycosylase
VYVYFVYGMYFQFNVVTGVRDVPHAVLVRALAPLEGIAVMRRRRPGRQDEALANGPGALCLALGIDRSHDRADLLGDRVWLETGPQPDLASAIARGPRVGIDYAGAWAARPWRFWLRGSPFVSRRRAPSGAQRDGGVAVAARRGPGEAERSAVLSRSAKRSRMRP